MSTCPSFCKPDDTDKCDNCVHGMDFKCTNCEDSCYEWDRTEPCKKCELGRETQHKQNKESLKYHSRRCRELRKEIKKYEEE